MKKLLLLGCFTLVSASLWGEQRFGRPVVKVQESKEYSFARLDDVAYPTLSNDKYLVTCLVYRASERYYVEIGVKNKTDDLVNIPADFVTFSKPGYSVYRTDTMMAARQAATAAGLTFVPTRAMYIPPTTNTTINATATTYGDQTQINGTATTTTDYSGQAGADLGNALGNAIAAHRFYKMQRTEAAFSSFLQNHAQSASGTWLAAGQTGTIVDTFQQAKQKKAPFEVQVRVGLDTFKFVYKE